MTGRGTLAPTAHAAAALWERNGSGEPLWNKAKARQNLKFEPPVASPRAAVSAGLRRSRATRESPPMSDAAYPPIKPRWSLWRGPTQRGHALWMGLLEVTLIVLGLWLLPGCTKDTDHQMVVSVPDQKMMLLKRGQPMATYAISTSKFGLGDAPGSYRTPLGRFEVEKMIGEGAPAGMVFKSRQPTGEVLPPNAAGRDPIVTRILWLKGIDDHNANAFERTIYIHGTPEERRLGTPASFGCVRMASTDIINLYGTVGWGARVFISTESDGPSRGPPLRGGAELAPVTDGGATRLSCRRSAAGGGRPTRCNWRHVLASPSPRSHFFRRDPRCRRDIARRLHGRNGQLVRGCALPGSQQLGDRRSRPKHARHRQPARGRRLGQPLSAYPRSGWWRLAWMSAHAIAQPRRGVRGNGGGDSPGAMLLSSAYALRILAAFALTAAALCLGACADAPVNASPVAPAILPPVVGGAGGDRGQATPSTGNPPADAAMRR